DQRACARDRREPRRRVHEHTPARLVVRPEDAAPRLAALGFRDEDVATLAAHFLDAEAHGHVSHGLARIEWLESWDDLDPEARPLRLTAEPEYERWDGSGALG